MIAAPARSSARSIWEDEQKLQDLRNTFIRRDAEEKHRRERRKTIVAYAATVAMLAAASWLFGFHFWIHAAR